MKQSVSPVQRAGSYVLLALLLLQLLPLPLAAQSRSDFRQPPASAPLQDFVPATSPSEGGKLAPDLTESVAAVRSSRQRDTLVPVIIQLSAPQAAALKAETATNPAPAGKSVSETPMQQAWRGKLGTAAGLFRKSFGNMGMVSAMLPLSKVEAMAQDSDVAYISPDRAVASTGHVAQTSGGDSGWNLIPAVSACIGCGVSVAVLDSGIDSLHTSFEANSTGRIRFSKDFTGQNTTEDRYGHGTHVASLVAGGWWVGGYYNGLAPGASLLNLRVLNEQGAGTASTVIAAIDWCITNKVAYNIRVINLSLGTPPKDSYRTDPLCLAARRAHNAGILVVASAGNNGKDALGRIMYGGINSPGIDPAVLTVGAANTFGTTTRADDKVTSFSSRGPTRSYALSATGVKRYDNLIKPDIVAPGNKLISAQSAAEDANAYSLVRTYPSLAVNPTAGTYSRAMYLSGTSMAAPIVSGTAALLFQARPDLTPALAKAILMYTAQPLTGENTLEQGAGLVNATGALELVKVLRSPLPATNGASLVTAAPPYLSYINYQPYSWGKGIITNYGHLTGNDLMNYWQGMYASGVVLGDGTPYASGTLTRSTTKTYGTLSLFSGSYTQGMGVVLGDGNAVFVSGVVLGDGLALGQGVVLGDGIVLGDGVVLGDNNPRADSAILGDNTTAMLPAP